MYYQPGPTTAYPSIQHITNDVWGGWLVRGMHKWGASVFIILMFLHMGRVFLFGAYKYPRELNWIIGVLLLASGLAEGFTGYLLPWDQTSYWATTVGINLNGTAPVPRPVHSPVPAGRHLHQRDDDQPLLLDPHADPAGDDRRADRAAHVPRDPPRRHLAALVEGGRRLRAALAAVQERLGPERLGSHRGLQAGRETGRRVANDRIAERQRVFKQYKEDVKERGKPFFPYAMLHDTIMSLVVVIVIITLAVIWKWSVPGNHASTGVGAARQALRPAGRPRHVQLRPAARLVLLLPLLPAADLQVAARR